MGGADRQRAAGGGLGGDHAERLGERARHDERLARGQQLRELLVVEPPGEHDALGSARAACEIALARAAPAGRAGTRAGAGERHASRPRPGSPAVERREQALQHLAVGAEADDDEPRVGHALEHERPGREQQVDALADDQLADERDEPLALRVQPLQRVGGGELVAGEGARRRVSLARLRVDARLGSVEAADASQRSPAPAAARSGSRGAKRATSTPGGPRRVRSKRRIAERLPQAGGGVTGADEHRARAGESLAREPRKRSGCGLTVYSSALPWTFTAYGTSPASARARITGPITRWFASATSGRASATTSRTAATLASM